MRNVILVFLLIVLGQLFCQMDFYIETDETNYSYGQDIYITFNHHNTSSDTITVTLINTAPYFYYIDDEAFVVPSFQVIVYVTLEPDSIYSFTHLHYEIVDIGEHEIIAEFHQISNSIFSDPIYFTVESVDICSNELQKVKPKLSNHPNPFNPSTTIEFSIPNDSYIEISVYNVKGQNIKTLIRNDFPEGSHSIYWEGDDDSGGLVNSGVYYSTLRVNGVIKAVNKCLMLK